MSNLIGVQTQWDSAEMLRYLEIVEPQYCMGINVLKREYLLEVRSRGAQYIYRHHPNFDEIGLTAWFADPELAAREAAAFLCGHLGDVLDLVRLVTDGNEYVLGPDHETSERIALADQYMAHFIKWARLVLGKGSIVGNFNTGHWRREGELVEYFPLMLQALQKDCEENPENGSRIGWHEYNWPLLKDGSYWRTATFLRAMPSIIEQYPLARCLITELGIDRVADEYGVPHEGFRKVPTDPRSVVDMFCGDDGLAWYIDRILEAGYVDGCLIFGCGMGDWRSMGFDIMNSSDDTAAPERIRLLPDMAPVEPPEPNGGEPMQVQIFDRDDIERDEAWMLQTYGVTWRRHGAEPGQQVYRLVELREKTGNSSLVTKVVDENGNPLANVDVAFYWSGAPDPPDPPTTVSPYDWYRNFVHGPTNANGDVGPGMGTGAYHGPGDCGPHKVWVRDPNIPSDICECLGMVAGTFHDHMDQKFKLTDAEVKPPDDPEPPADLLAVLRLDANVAKILSHLLKTPPDEPDPPDPELEVFHVEFFNNEELAGEPVYTMTEAPPFWHDWGAGSPAPGVNTDHVSGRWSGGFAFDEAKTYRFNVKTDDGVRLWVDGNLVLDKWYPMAPTPFAVTVPLTAGLHEVVLEWFERAGGATLHFNWE